MQRGSPAVGEPRCISSRPNGAAMFRFTLPALFAVLVVPTCFADDEKGYLGVQIKLQDEKIKVIALLDDSPAAKAGFKEGDLIEQIGDLKPTTLQEFVDEVGKNKAGSKVVFTITRDGKE